MVGWKCIRAYVKNKENQNQICWIWQKVSVENDKDFHKDILITLRHLQQWHYSPHPSKQQSLLKIHIPFKSNHHLSLFSKTSQLCLWHSSSDYCKSDETPFQYSQSTSNKEDMISMMFKPMDSNAERCRFWGCDRWGHYWSVCQVLRRALEKVEKEKEEFNHLRLLRSQKTWSIRKNQFKKSLLLLKSKANRDGDDQG